MQTTTKGTRKRGRPPTFKPGDFSPFLDDKLREIRQEIARLQAAHDAIVMGAKEANRGRASARRS
jgi:hypothetical protein